MPTTPGDLRAHRCSTSPSATPLHEDLAVPSRDFGKKVRYDTNASVGAQIFMEDDPIAPCQLVHRQYRDEFWIALRDVSMKNPNA